MEESSGVHSEENKASMDKDRKRRLKTPAQVMALEKFYDDHKYPTEEMKSQLAEQIGLTEKQISGWFCHRRLKDKKLFRDEACPSGRQDHSGAVIQDRGSGLVQDSCGSTKHGDYRHIDPREVESRRLYRNDFQAADLTYEHATHYTGTVSGTDNTSSESSSSSQDRLFCQTEDPDDRENSRYLTHNGVIAPINATSEKVIGYKPSGYLKVKGEIENAAVTAVKRQLGRHYREDGPLLGVEFQPLPPGAFESPIRNTIREPYHVGNPSLSHSPDISGLERQSSLSNDLYMERENCGSMHGSDNQDKISHPQFKQNSTVLNHTKPFCKQNSFSDLYEDSAGETTVYSNKRNQRMSGKHDVEGMRTDAIANRHTHYDGKIASELHDYDNVSPNIIHMSEKVKLKPSILIRKPCESVDTDTEERGLSMRMKKKEKVNGKLKGIKEYGNQVNLKMHPTKEMMVAKRVRPDIPKTDYVKKASFTGVPTWKHRSKGSVMEIPSSFSEDETAETSASLE
ncbi:homeobox-DDT domain protein RLT1-like isoform X2 [Juglans microcarpa x Juglans regia]|uniref:homeobox-DDT domain protein RLT1-like isoform X2 n=1 Tax=Juglans microcarpa x Juglans regia TaxID=2249226 RepID=UPI001B7E9283|nr:homeobox-DDT domain protein RLT1-like isoform X2 [Juglans microcarpa x Juglans regia]